MKMNLIYLFTNSGVASIGAREQSAPLDSEKFVRNREKEAKIRKKRGKTEKFEKKRKNLEESAKIGKVLLFCPS